MVLGDSDAKANAFCNSSDLLLVRFLHCDGYIGTASYDEMYSVL